MADKHPAPNDKNTVPNDSCNNEEETLNFYLAAALKEEIAQRRNERTMALPNSRSDSSLNIGSLIPAYLNGFKIPRLAGNGSTASTSSNASSDTQASSQSSLSNAINNLNVNQHEGSATGSATDQGPSEMETEEQPPASNSPPANNPFRETPATDGQTVDVSKSLNTIDLSQDNFYDSLEDSQIDSQASQVNLVDSVRQTLFSKNINKEISTVTSDSNLEVRSPLRLRRSGRLLTKQENLGVKVPSSKGKLGKKLSSKASKRAQLSRLFNLGSQGLSQEILDFDMSIQPILNSKSKKRLHESSPGSAEPRKQNKTEAHSENKGNSQFPAPKEKRSHTRSRTRGADESGESSHASGTPTGINKRNVNKQTHVVPPRGSNRAADLHYSQAAGPSRLSPAPSPWPSAHNLDEFKSDLSPIPNSGRETGILNLSDVLNTNLDPLAANELMTPLPRSNSSVSSNKSSSSDESISLVSIYPPRSLRGGTIRSNKSLEMLTSLKSNQKDKNPTLDPIEKLVQLCENTKFTGEGPQDLNLPKPATAPNPDKVGFSVTNTSGPLSTLKTWADYQESLDSNPFSSTNFNSASASASTNNKTNIAKKASNSVSTNKIVVTNNTNSSQEPPKEPLFEDAKSIWQQLRNALCRDVILRLRQRNIETMMDDGLVPNWAVSYKPPTSLLTNENHVNHVIRVRKQIFITQLECTLYLTKKEIASLKLRIDDLKRSLYSLYQTPAGKQYNFDAALNSAIIQADKQRRITFEELNKRLTVIRQAPEEALWMGIPEEFPRSANAIRPQQNDDAQPGPSNEGQSTGSRSRSNQRWGQVSQPQQRPRSRSNQRQDPPGARPGPSNPRQGSTRQNQGGNQKNQKNGWVQVVNKRSKGKGQGKRSKGNNGPYNRNNQARREEQRSPENELLDLMAAFVRKYQDFKGNKQ